MGLFDQYIPPDVPSGAVDPQELERAKYLAMIRAGLGVANREPLQNAFGGGLKAYIGAQANARQQMLAQLQAYKDRQEIGAKAKTMQQNEALQGDLKNVFGSAPITEAGGPTEANATLAMIGQYERAAVRLAAESKFEDAKRASDIANGLKEKYGLEQRFFIGPDGKLQSGQLSERGKVLIHAQTPAQEKSYHEAGGKIFESAKYTGQTGTEIAKTPTFADQVAARNQAIQQAQEKRAAATFAVTGGVTPHYDPNLGFVYPPSPVAPAGKIEQPPGFQPTEKPLTESQAKALAFATQQSAATDIVNKLQVDKKFTGKGWQQTDLARAQTEGIPYVPGSAAIPRWMSSDEAQQYDQASTAWSEAQLRFLTGANAPDHEVTRNRNLFFPQPGDSDAKVDQKAQMRVYAEQAIRYAAGHGVSKLPPLAQVPISPEAKAAAEAALLDAKVQAARRAAEEAKRRP